MRAPSPLLLALLTLSGCTKDAPAPSPPADNGAASEASATSADAKCPSYAGLDRSTLPPLPPSQWSATFDTVWTTVLTKHYDVTINCVDWPAARVTYGEKLSAAKDQAQAYAVMSEMLLLLGQSHLGLVPPHQATQAEPRVATQTGPATAPIAVRWLEDSVVVVDPAVDGHASKVPGGAALLAIDGTELSEIVVNIQARHSKEIEAAFDIRRAVTGMLTCPVGGTKSIRYRAAGGDKAKTHKDKTHKVKCVELDRERVSMGNLQNVPVEMEHKIVKGTTVGYLRFNIWMLPLTAKIEAAIAELRESGMTALVIDLRGNPGGVGMMVVPLGRILLAEPTSLGTMHMRDMAQHFNVANVDDDPFLGPMAILVDEGTASTSEIFAQAFQDLGRATVFGAGPSLGAALPSLIEELGDGGLMQYVVADYKSPKDIAVEGKGVVPDTVVAETRADYAAGRDPVLDAAVAALAAP